MIPRVQLVFGMVLLAGPVLCQNAPGGASLDQQAEALYNKGDLKEAIRIAKLAVDSASDRRQSAHSLDRLGFFEYTAGDIKSGETALRQAIDMRKVDPGIDSADYAESANDLALLCRDSGKFSEARTLAQQAVTIRTRILGPHDLKVAESLNTLGSAMALNGDYELAIARFEQALAIHESQAQGAQINEEYGTLCVNAAATYQRAGKYDKAEELFKKGVDVLRVKPGTNHPAYSASLVSYAYLQADLGHYSAAEKLYNESGILLREQLGDQHPVYASFLNNRAALYTLIGNWTAAESDYRKSLELKRKIYGPNALITGASLRNLARLISARNLAEGEKLFKEAVAVYAANAKAPPYDYSSALLGLADAQRRRGDLVAAREALRHASDIASKSLGVQHPLYAAVLDQEALVEAAAHEYGAAEKTFEEAIAIVEQKEGSDHPDLAGYLEQLADVHVATGDDEGALALYRRSVAIYDRAVSEMLTIGAETNKVSIIANVGDPISTLVSFQQRAGDRLPAARVLAFEAVARRKGLVLDQVHDWGQTLRQNPETRAAFNRRNAMLACQASLSVALGYRDLKPAVVGTCALPGTELEGRYERLLHDLRMNWTDTSGRSGLDAVAVLQKQIETAEANLSRAIPQFASTAKPPGMAEIQSRLRQDEELVEFVAYSSSDPRAPGRRYGAFLLLPTGDPRWVDLGPVQPINRAVQDLIAAANDRAAALSSHEERSATVAEQTAGEARAMLSKELRPVIAEVSDQTGVHRLRVAPDGLLNLVPFAALSDSRGHFLVQQYAISYVSAGRELVAPPSAPASERAANSIVIAVSPGAGSKHSESVATNRIRADRLERLDGAQAEANEVQRWIPEARLLGEGEATEQRIKQLHHPALLHIVGHGIVRGNEDCAADPTTPTCGLSDMSPAARVMSLSAIVLEEAYGRGGRSPEDGLLTALELQTLDLQGTEMLVLSQCRMADGVPSSGEGVFGMRRAAAIAGVRTFVAPLWKIGDSTQQDLIGHFYRELSAGQGRAEALRRAQLHLMRNPQTSSFLEWAPVILSGDPGPLPRRWFAR